MGKYDHLSKEELLKLIEKQEQELKNKKYGLVWDSEKEPEQVVLDCVNHLPVLKRVKSKEIKTDDSEDNILIEGDNYHALTVLNYSHKGGIDVIYIDPPYNTGKANEWKYNDKYVDKNDSYRHSKWLNFIEKRLKLAKELLKDDGVIFVSIGNDEFAQLKLLMDKIFGENKFYGVLTWINRTKPTNMGDARFNIQQNTEYILVYGIKTISEHKPFNLYIDEKKEYPYFDGKNRYRVEEIVQRRNLGALRRDTMLFPILGIFPEEGYRWQLSKKKYEELLSKNAIRKINGKLYKIIYEYEEDNVSYKPFWSHLDNVGTAETGKRELNEILGIDHEFETVKPSDLIKRILFHSTDKHSIILDFFAGSGTTGHAVLELNKEDGGNRKFILVTNNEEINGNGDKVKHKICTDVCYPRLKKIIEGYEFKGKDKKVLYEKKLTFTQLKKIDEILEEINLIIEENKDSFDEIKKEFKDNTIKIIGVKNIDGFKEGLGGNLQYFKTSLIKKSKNRDQVKIDLTQKATEMLCVKENIYNLEKEGEDYKIFSSNKKDRFLCIYYNFIDDSFSEFLEELKKFNGKKIIYMFAIDNKVDKSLFSELEDFTIEPIPQKILDIYDQLVKMNIPIKAETIFIDLEKAKKQIFENEDKDTGAKILRVVLEKLLQKIAQLNQINILNEKGKEIKISNLNDILKAQNVLSQVEWQENQTYLTIGNHASHGEYDEYDLEQVKNFYKHIQSLIDKFNI